MYHDYNRVEREQIKLELEISKLRRERIFSLVEIVIKIIAILVAVGSLSIAAMKYSDEVDSAEKTYEQCRKVD